MASAMGLQAHAARLAAVQPAGQWASESFPNTPPNAATAMGLASPEPTSITKLAATSTPVQPTSALAELYPEPPEMDLESARLLRQSVPGHSVSKGFLQVVLAILGFKSCCDVALEDDVAKDLHARGYYE